MLIAGSCHCRNIQFSLRWEPEPASIPARVCTCSFCLKHGAAWTSCPGGALEVTVRDPSLVTPYEFATKSARFHVCTRCGMVPLVTCELDGRTYGVVNVNALEGVDPALLSRVSMDFEHEPMATRLARRQRNWIPDVRFSTP